MKSKPQFQDIWNEIKRQSKNESDLHDTELYVNYRGHQINVTKEGNNNFYVTVMTPQGTYLCEGYCDIRDNVLNIKDATEWAMKGSLLIQEENNGT